MAEDARFADELRVIVEATQCFHRWQDHKQHPPPRPDVAAIEQEIESVASKEANWR
jgi:hypothetical protein